MLPAGLRGVPQGEELPGTEPALRPGLDKLGAAPEKHKAPSSHVLGGGREEGPPPRRFVTETSPGGGRQQLPPCRTLPHGRASPRSGGRREGGTCEACKPYAAIAPPSPPPRRSPPPIVRPADGEHPAAPCPPPGTPAPRGDTSGHTRVSPAAQPPACPRRPGPAPPARPAEPCRSPPAINTALPERRARLPPHLLLLFIIDAAWEWETPLPTCRYAPTGSAPAPFPPSAPR